ncbi:MAG: hypothetical protein IPP15_19445 [Saprospiraceae bacterium]|uniref:Uncharacterized protein n=1 Tax=Candidatus Opimibacter skivensis TaxID=2982028 RepID=A0A9D7SYL5_9BACT|nr:hypothetical protein [Candidatus Opimibacter skivensis]
MKYLFYISISLSFIFLNFSGCDKKDTTDPLCNQITLNKPFLAKIDEQWCLDQANWSIRFGPLVEDSRCNVPGIDCFWAGRFVMAATIINSDGEERDTFYAVRNWTDTLQQGIYNIYLNKIYPEMRPTMELLDPSKYSFDVIIEKR